MPSASLSKLNEEFHKLAQNPGMGTDRSIYIPDLRGWPFGEYIIFYRPIDKRIEVVRVISARRETEINIKHS